MGSGNAGTDPPAGSDDAAVRVAWGTATGPTALAAYDAALAEAGVGNYNLVRVSSIVPARATVEPVGTAPDLGPAGNRLTVVEAKVAVGGDAGRAGSERVSAGLGWATGPGPGLFYEVAGEFDEAECSRRLAAGLDAGRTRRDWTFDEAGERVVSIEVPAGGYASAVVLGAYGESEPIL